MGLKAYLFESVASSRDSGIEVGVDHSNNCPLNKTRGREKKGQWATSVENEDVRLKKGDYK